MWVLGIEPGSCTKRPVLLTMKPSLQPHLLAVSTVPFLIIVEEWNTTYDLTFVFFLMALGIELRALKQARTLLPSYTPSPVFIPYFETGLPRLDLSTHSEALNLHSTSPSLQRTGITVLHYQRKT